MDICHGIYETVVEHLDEILALRSTKMLKSDNTYVSKGDLLCQKVVFDYLNSTLDDFKVVSEEADFSNVSINSAKRIITIDPIDGTENFVSGLKEWGVGVSVYCDGTHEQSMILLPELGLSLFTGESIDEVEGSRICGLSSYMSGDDFSGLDKSYEYRIMGCCMYNMYNVIKGSYSKFLHLKGAYSWDILPGINLAIEHGLRVLIEGELYHGQFLQPGVKYHFEVDRVCD